VPRVDLAAASGAPRSPRSRRDRPARVHSPRSSSPTRLAWHRVDRGARARRVVDRRSPPSRSAPVGCRRICRWRRGSDQLGNARPTPISPRRALCPRGASARPLRGAGGDHPGPSIAEVRLRRGRCSG
jgi:hypothetical protein